MPPKMVLHSLSLTPPEKKKVRAVKTAPTTAAMAAESVSHRGTPSLTRTNPGFRLARVLTVGGSPTILSNAGFSSGAQAYQRL